jgi:hypothetical protein
MDDRIKSIIEIIDRLENRINAYWNFYFIVVFASIGWLMSSRMPFTTNQGIALTIALSIFFLVNFFVMRSATERVVAFEDELKLISNKFEFNSSILKSNLSKTSMPLRLYSLCILHFVIDISVIYAIWSKLS